MFDRSETVCVHGFVFCRLTMAEGAGEDDHDGEEENLLTCEETGGGLVSTHHASIRTPGGILARQSHLREHIPHTGTLAHCHTVTNCDKLTLQVGHSRLTSSPP